MAVYIVVIRRRRNAFFCRSTYTGAGTTPGALHWERIRHVMTRLPRRLRGGSRVLQGMISSVRLQVDADAAYECCTTDRCEEPPRVRPGLHRVQ